MTRFKYAQVGDKVYSRLDGKGVITEISPVQLYAISVTFSPSNRQRSFTMDGRAVAADVEPILFYQCGDSHYLTTRPESPIDWTTVRQPSSGSGKVWVTDRDMSYAVPWAPDEVKNSRFLCKSQE